MHGLGMFGEGLFIKSVKAGSPAHKCGQLNVGDRYSVFINAVRFLTVLWNRILEINGEDVSRTTLSHMKKALSKSRGHVRLVITRRFVAEQGGAQKSQLQQEVYALTTQLEAQKTESEQLRVECAR